MEKLRGSYQVMYTRYEQIHTITVNKLVDHRGRTTQEYADYLADRAARMAARYKTYVGVAHAAYIVYVNDQIMIRGYVKG